MLVRFRSARTIGNLTLVRHTLVHLIITSVKAGIALESGGGS